MHEMQYKLGGALLSTKLKLTKANPGNAEYISRFSMCNCLTLYFPDTYTAHALTMNVFLRHAIPGTRFVLPYTNLWPSGYVRVYKFPKRINTFLFSPFNESYHPNYTFGSCGDRYTIGPHPGAMKLKKLATPVARLSGKKFISELREVEKKVNKIWNKPLKILVLYDSARASNVIKQRIRRYDKLSTEAVNWPIVKVNDTIGGTKKWCWYHKQIQTLLLKDIIQREENY
jgi:hypothetical protein